MSTPRVMYTPLTKGILLYKAHMSFDYKKGR
jgi:hypothetical protein